MRRFAFGTILTLVVVGCTHRDEDGGKNAGALKDDLATTRQELAETKAALKRMLDAEKDRLRNPDRHAADWVLANGGVLFLRVGDRPVEVHAIGELPTEHFQVLQVFLKSNRKINDAGLAELRGLSHIRSLDLFDTKIGDPALPSIASLTTLEGLTLRDTQVTDAGAVQLKKLTNLKLLDLVGTSVTPATAESLRRSLPGCQIDLEKK